MKFDTTTLQLGQFPMIFFRFLAALIISVQLAHAQGSEPQVVGQPVLGGDPLIDYRITDCDGTRGYGLLTQGTLGRIIRLSDVCLLESRGSVAAGVSINGLQLTKQSPNGRAFEDLTSGDDEYSRNRISIYPDGNAPGCTPETVENFEFVLPNGPNLSGGQNGDFTMLQGYTLPATKPLPKRESAEVLIGLRNLTQGELAAETMPAGIVNAIGDMYGQATFGHNSGTLHITKGGGYFWGGAVGELSFKFSGDGGFTASGTFSAKSIRIAGHQPHEMVTISGSIPYMRGHVVGSDGAELLGYGLATGTYLDASGAIHEFRASTYLISCMK